MDDLISREKAIEALQEHRNLFCDNTPETFSKLSYAEKSRVDELDMAIATLINLPSAQPDSKELSFTQKKLDTISRQAAIRWVKTECNPYGKPTLDFESGKKVIEHLKQMPSAQPELIRINLNEPIKVKLTDWGKEIYYHQYDRTNQIAGREICKPRFPREDENGYTEFQLWCFIELYGMHIGMTLPNVIEPLEIVYER